MYIAFYAARVKRTLNLSLNHHRVVPSSNRFAFSLSLPLSLFRSSIFVNDLADTYPIPRNTYQCCLFLENPTPR